MLTSNNKEKKIRKIEVILRRKCHTCLFSIAKARKNLITQSYEKKNFCTYFVILH